MVLSPIIASFAAERHAFNILQHTNMYHPLDNPIWNALNTGNKNIANGNQQAKYFSKDVSPFVALEEPTQQNFEELYNVIPDAGYYAFPWAVELTIPQPWETKKIVWIRQMVWENPTRQIDNKEPLLPLGDEHIPQMLALTQLTNPGPFSERTIDFGYYSGIFDGDKLIAMAGQRMNPEPYAEISAVCTHPDYLGRGHAARLLLYHVERIKAAGGIPYLNVLTENARAIAVYESLGFVTRMEMPIYTIQKK
nr:ribosomal protein S18 acetylase RimI-like enzyme [Mucilaginibacter sp. X4EP1]